MPVFYYGRRWIKSRRIGRQKAKYPAECGVFWVIPDGINGVVSWLPSWLLFFFLPFLSRHG